jgi:hypothetical protein
MKRLAWKSHSCLADQCDRLLFVLFVLGGCRFDGYFTEFPQLDAVLTAAAVSFPQHLTLAEGLCCQQYFWLDFV